MFIDTHTHLYLNDFNEDRNEIITEALNLNIKKLLLPNIDSSTIDDLIQLCEKNKNVCYPMIGLHPCSVNENFQGELHNLHNYIKQINPIAIGEIGIDLYWDKTTLNEQLEAFKQQIKWAKDYNQLIYFTVI